MQLNAPLNIAIPKGFAVPNNFVPTEKESISFCRHDLAAFIEKTFKIISPGVKFEWNWHIECIAEYLTACANREIKRLIINVPPRSLKSVSCSVAWPAYLLGQEPATRIMTASYSKELSTKHSVDCRFLMESEWYQKCFPGTRIAADNNQKTKYITTARGQRFATSVGATATGEGGNFLIVDDPHNAEEAQSKVIRESQIRWFDQSFSTRLDNKERDVMLVIMQRLHEKDLTGHLLEMSEWHNLVLPAQFIKKTIVEIGHFKHTCEKGSILHPAREDAKVLEQTKRQMGSYAYSAQYMQQPVPEGGGIFKNNWFRLFPNNKPLPKFDYVIQSWDTAFTEDTENDYTAFTAWGVFRIAPDRPLGAMLLDAWQDHMEYPDLRKRAKSEYKTLYGEGDGRRSDCVLIEDKGSGITLRQDLIRSGVPVFKYNPGRADKTQRANAVSYLPENGLIFIPESDKFKNKPTSWAEEVIKQLCSFPKAEHDDFVDSCVQAWQLLKDQSWLTIDIPDDDHKDERLAPVNPYAQ